LPRTTGSTGLDVPTPYKVVLDAIHFHFNRNRWVQQDLETAGGPVESKFLEFAYTSEDAVLDPVDSKRAFGQ
jgi:hypothetical protein